MQRSAYASCTRASPVRCELADLAVRRAARAAARRSPAARAARARRGCARRRRPACPCSASSVIAPATCAVCQSVTSVVSSASAPTAVCACVPLMSASPSFGSSTTGASPAGRQRRAAVGHGAADARPRPRRSARARGATSGARSPLAPTLPCSGIARVHARVQHRRAAARRARAARPSARARARWRAAAAWRAPRAVGSSGADARRVAPHEVHLQLPQPLGRDRDVGELAEPGRDAVDHRAAGERARPRRARVARMCARPRGRAGPRAVARHAPQLRERQRPPIDDHVGCRHACNVGVGGAPHKARRGAVSLRRRGRQNGNDEPLPFGARYVCRL